MPQERRNVCAQLSGFKGLKGKQPVYFVFSSTTKAHSVCDLYDFVLSAGKGRK